MLDLKHTKQTINALDADLSGSAFTDVNLASATFSDVNLTGTTISNANLSSVRISDANLSGASIDGIGVAELLAAYGAAQNLGTLNRRSTPWTPICPVLPLRM